MVASPEGDVKATVEQPAVEPSDVPVAYIRPVAEGCERVRQELVKYPEWDANTMMAIAIAENRSCDPYNHNLTGSENHGVCVGSYGVLQVDVCTLPLGRIGTIPLRWSLLPIMSGGPKGIGLGLCIETVNIKNIFRG